MLSCDGSRSTLTALLAGMLMLAGIAPALGQAVPTASSLPPTELPPAPPATDIDLPPASVALPPASSPPPANPSQPNSTAPYNPPPAYNGTLLAYSLASVPDMMGDTPNRGHYDFLILGGRSATIPIAGGDGYGKIADDTSPIPTDRVFFDYNYFNHAVQTGNSALTGGAAIGLNRYTFGVEKTFFDGCCSIEVQTPIESGLNDTQFFGGTTGENEGTVFGDMSVTLKCLIYRCDCLAISVGTMVDLPTAPNGTFVNGPDSLTIRNDSVHVAPFLGFAYAPCCGNFFATGFVQVDVDANGDPVNENFVGTDPDIGRLRDPSLLYVDLATGYWLYRDQPLCGRYLTGIAPVVELHYTTTLQNYRGIADAVDPIYAGTDCLNLTAGLHFQMGPCSMLTVGGVVPLLTSGRDREFDSEVVVQFDRRF
jgi:hypothetical protein